MPRFSFVLLSALLLVALASCTETTTEPGTSPAAASLSTATTALSFYQVSGGGSHTCGITTDNRAYCWGAPHASSGGSEVTHSSARRLLPAKS
jgi:hypothetical protein